MVQKHILCGKVNVQCAEQKSGGFLSCRLYLLKSCGFRLCHWGVFSHVILLSPASNVVSLTVVTSPGAPVLLIVSTLCCSIFVKCYKQDSSRIGSVCAWTHIHTPWYFYFCGTLTIPIPTNPKSILTSILKLCLNPETILWSYGDHPKCPYSAKMSSHC